LSPVGIGFERGLSDRQTIPQAQMLRPILRRHPNWETPLRWAANPSGRPNQTFESQAVFLLDSTWTYYCKFWPSSITLGLKLTTINPLGYLTAACENRWQAGSNAASCRSQISQAVPAQLPLLIRREQLLFRDYFAEPSIFACQILENQKLNLKGGVLNRNIA
jgi:hypothetical protein